MQERLDTTSVETTSAVWQPGGATTFYSGKLPLGVQIKIQAAVGDAPSQWTTVDTMHAGKAVAKVEKVTNLRLVLTGNQSAALTRVYTEEHG